MTLLRVLSLLLGVAAALLILGSALKTVVLPQGGFPRLSQAVFAAVYRLFVHGWRTRTGFAASRSIYAPVALVSLPLVWMILMVIAFTFTFWGTGSLTFSKAFEISGSSLTTLGFSKPSGTSRIWIAFVEATIGLGLVALLISYLPTIFSAYNGRERGIITLRPLAGAPPTATEFVQTLHRLSALDDPDFWRLQAGWIVDVEQSHTSFPILSYFPEHDVDESWVATLGMLLDAAALVYSASEARADERFEDVQKGPLMILSFGLPALGRVAGAVNIPLPRPSRLPDVVAHFGEPAPPVSIGQAEYLGVLASLAPILGVGSGQDEAAWRRFAWIRSGYDDALRALAGLTQAAPAMWTTDRPADVGKPRFLRRRPLRVDWTANLPAGVGAGSQVAATGG
jgi:hypothetical protein